jgi:hypothetical protein
MAPLAAMPASAEFAWVTGTSGGTEIPGDAVYAGSEGGADNYVCRASYLDGVHPGKLFAGHCNIEFAGQELVRDDFEVLTAPMDSYVWIDDSLGFAPDLSYPAGLENGISLLACRAIVKLDDQDRGSHAGKIIGENCNIPYGGGAFLSKTYAVLTFIEEPVPARKPVWKAVRAGGPGAFKGWSADGRALPKQSGTVLKAR